MLAKCQFLGCVAMYLSWLLKNVIYRLICGNIEIPVSDIIYDSRKNVMDCVFVCLKGMNFDGHDYISEVISQGACAVVVQKDAAHRPAVSGGVTIIEVENTREALGEMSRAFFDYPERRLKLIGITGTKGKTTVAGMLRHVFEQAGIRTGIMGTIEISTGKRTFPTSNTTPESYLVQKYLSMMAEDGCQAAVMEVSSQALMCGRVFGVKFDYGIITNISPDHIGPGEHKDFDDYIHWKGQLFKQCRVGIVNGMDANVLKALKGHTCAVETYGIREKYNEDKEMDCGNTGNSQIQPGPDGLYDYYAENIRILKDNCPDAGKCRPWRKF